MLRLSGTVGQTTLTEEQIASHDHPFGPPHCDRYSGGSGQSWHGNTAEAATYNWETGLAGGSQSHTHALDGSTGSENCLPPYYALAMVMRLS